MKRKVMIGTAAVVAIGLSLALAFDLCGSLKSVLLDLQLLGFQRVDCLGGVGVVEALLNAFFKTGPTASKSILGESITIYQ